MTWNWEQPHWPKFTYDSAALEPLEPQFLLHSGEFVGALVASLPDLAHVSAKWNQRDVMAGLVPAIHVLIAA